MDVTHTRSGRHIYTVSRKDARGIHSRHPQKSMRPTWQTTGRTHTKEIDDATRIAVSTTDTRRARHYTYGMEPDSTPGVDIESAGDGSDLTTRIPKTEAELWFRLWNSATDPPKVLDNALEVGVPEIPDKRVVEDALEIEIPAAPDQAEPINLSVTRRSSPVTPPLQRRRDRLSSSTPVSTPEDSDREESTLSRQDDEDDQEVFYSKLWEDTNPRSFPSQGGRTLSPPPNATPQQKDVLRASLECHTSYWIYLDREIAARIRCLRYAVYIDLSNDLDLTFPLYLADLAEFARPSRHRDIKEAFIAASTAPHYKRTHFVRSPRLRMSIERKDDGVPMLTIFKNPEAPFLGFELTRTAVHTLQRLYYPILRYADSDLALRSTWQRGFHSPPY